MENELVLMPEDLTKLGFENVGGDPISYWTINKGLFTETMEQEKCIRFFAVTMLYLKTMESFWIM